MCGLDHDGLELLVVYQLRAVVHLVGAQTEGIHRERTIKPDPAVVIAQAPKSLAVTGSSLM